MWLFRYRYSKRKFLYYATMHRTIFHVEHNDHTFHSVLAYYACSTSTVWEHFIDAYCMYHTLLQLTVPAVSRISSMHWALSTSTCCKRGTADQIASFPGPHPASRRLQYGKAREGLVHFLMWVTSWTGQIIRTWATCKPQKTLAHTHALVWGDTLPP